MKIIDAKTTISVLLTLLVLTGVFMLQKSYALVENTPSIVSFKRSNIEDNALKVEVKSNNTGSDFSLEILNITKGTRVNVAGSTTSYTFQNLIKGKEYEVMVRACSISDTKYKCTDYSPGVKAIAGEKDQAPEVKTPVLSSLTPSTSSVRLNYTTSGNVTGVEIVNETNKKTYKTTNKSTFTETGLKEGVTYNYKIRAYYILNNQTYPSSYTGVKSVTTTKIVVKTPKLSSVKALNTSSIKLTYKTSGNVTGVQIYNTKTKKTITTKNKTAYTWKGLKEGTKYSFRIRSYYIYQGKPHYSNYTVGKSARTKTEKEIVLAKIKKLKKYSSLHTIRTYSRNSMHKIKNINSGYTEKVPQSFCSDGSHYIVQYSRYNSNNYGRIISYKKSGKRVKTGPKIYVKHANGLACGKNISKMYSVNRGGSTCTVINKSTFKKTKTFSLPAGAYGIAYDDLTNQFYIGGGGYIRVLNSKFKQVRKIGAKRNYNHHQDVGAYHGLILVSYTQNKNGLNYIDIYRSTDGAYLGSYKVTYGELESALIDNGYLIFLINKVGTSDDYILRSNYKVSFP